MRSRAPTRSGWSSAAARLTRRSLRPTTATSSRRSSSWSRREGRPHAPELPPDDQRELRIAQEIAPPEPARLARQAVEPLESIGRHPPRRARNRSGDEVERGSDADEDGRHVLTRGVDEELLLRRAECDEHDLGPGGPDFLDDRRRIA